MSATPTYPEPNGASVNPEDVIIETIFQARSKDMPSSGRAFTNILLDQLDKGLTIHPNIDTIRMYIDLRGDEAFLCVTQERPMTEDEKSALAASRAKALLEREEAERATLKTLLTKYGVPDEYR